MTIGRDPNCDLPVNLLEAQLLLFQWFANFFRLTWLEILNPASHIPSRHQVCY